MLEVLFDYESVIQYEFIPEDQTVNKELYLEIRKWLWDVTIDEKDLKNGKQEISFFYTTMVHHITFQLSESTLTDAALPLWNILFILPL